MHTSAALIASTDSSYRKKLEEAEEEKKVWGQTSLLREIRAGKRGDVLTTKLSTHFPLFPFFPLCFRTLTSLQKTEPFLIPNSTRNFSHLRKAWRSLFSFRLCVRVYAATLHTSIYKYNCIIHWHKFQTFHFDLLFHRIVLIFSKNE